MSVAVKTETAFRQVLEHAESIRNDDAHKIATMSPGDMWAQGDVGIICLKAITKDCILIDQPNSQLAPGTTQGSRHCIADADMSSVRLYRIADPTQLDGPVIEALTGFTVEHPEHGDVTFPPGVYGVIYQRQYANELKRVQD